ncbi:MAG: hypothetical protein C3F06_00710 [Candidatus Methanoperedenaceae archaeon]|nr:MAG: hypothetical protein C3F06_00710 [Candidatus Methanoperedenaceae archaeon]
MKVNLSFENSKLRSVLAIKEMESVFNLNDKASRVLIRLSSIEDVHSAKRLWMQQSIKGEIS